MTGPKRAPADQTGDVPELASLASLMILYPILLNLKDEPCVIVGGGPVARRKVEHLLEAGARVRVVASDAEPRIRQWAKEGKIELKRQAYRTEHLNGEIRLAFACTASRAVNRRVVADAEKRGIEVNCADDPEASGFHVPSMVRRGDFLLTVSTGGKAPALSRELRRRLARQYGPAWADFTDLLGELRKGWKKSGEAGKIHARMIEVLASDTFEVMQSRGPEAARRHARRLIRRAEAAETKRKPTKPSRGGD